MAVDQGSEETAEDQDTTAPSIYDYFEILRARKKAFAGALTLVLLVVVLVTFSETPIYRATSLLLIEPRKPNVANVNVQEVVDASMGAGGAEFYKTQFEILTSRRIVEPVAVALRKAYPGYSLSASDIQIDPITGSHLLRVSVDSRSAKFATEAANALVNQYVDDTAQRMTGISDRGLSKLREMEAALRPRYEEAIRTEQKFKEENDLSALDETQSLAAQRLKVLTDALATSAVARAKAQAECQAADSALLSSSVTVRAEPQAGPAGAAISAQLAQAELERADLAKRVKHNHPLMLDNEARIAELKSLLERARLAYVASLHANLETALQQQRALEGEVFVTEGELRGLARKAVRLQFLKREADTLAAEYNGVTHRIGEVSLAIAAGAKETNVFVIDPAVEPGGSVKPDKKRNLAFGLVAGIVAGFFLCLGLERLDNTFRNIEDIERLVNYPVLGSIPFVHPKNGNGNGAAAPAIELLSAQQPRGLLAESFRSIRTALSFTLPPGSRHAIVVTSPAPAEGKTFSSVSLAHSLAQNGKRVLLVDADLRRGRIHKIFGLGDCDAGLSTLLSGDSQTVAEARRPSTIERLDVLPTGPRPPNPAELLHTERMRTVIDQALHDYDWVILDAPPVVFVADAAILFAQTQLALLVVRTLLTEKRGALRAREILKRTPGRVAGVIVNEGDGFRGYGSKYYRYGYAYRYGYRSEDYAEQNNDAEKASS